MKLKKDRVIVAKLTHAYQIFSYGRNKKKIIKNKRKFRIKKRLERCYS